MGVAQVDTERLGRIDPRVHAGQDEVFLRRGEREMALCESRGVLIRRRFDVLLDCRH